MASRFITLSICAIYLFLMTSAFAAESVMETASSPKFDESTPTWPFWGFRPVDGSRSSINPPPFGWKRQSEATEFQLEYSTAADFSKGVMRADGLKWPAYCPSQVMAEGKWFWRVRFLNKKGEASQWSSTRSFEIAADAKRTPMPSKEDLISRIPKGHPRLFMRPEQLPEFRRRSEGELKPQFDELIKVCESNLKDPPSTKEPEKYPAGCVRGDREWGKLWWPNRVYVMRAGDAATSLGLGYRLTGKMEYGLLAKRMLLDMAAWDPVGATGGRYNDEAGMPAMSRMARAYTFVSDLLTEEEKKRVCSSIKVRASEFYDDLSALHFDSPYGSHANRVWHFLGETAIAFMGEIPEAKDWLWLSMNVYYCVYPVWSDDDGGWHEGVNYWRAYVDRYTIWAGIMRPALGIDGYEKPFFRKAGYYAMYLMPPGTNDSGFGDESPGLPPEMNTYLMQILANQLGNSYWQWYADQLFLSLTSSKDGRLRRYVNQNLEPIQIQREKSLGYDYDQNVYLNFIFGGLPKATPAKPSDLPTSRCFHNTGLAVLNSDIINGKDNIQIQFKSSPFGAFCHGSEPANAFLFNAYGERLLIRAGYRDYHGSAFHTQYLWDTRSVNGILVDGKGQMKGRTPWFAKGKITAFSTSKVFDYTAGDATESYGGLLKGIRRQIIMCKPSAVLIVDTVESPRRSTFEFLLHSIKPMDVRSQEDIRVTQAGASCQVSILHPRGLSLTTTDQFDVKPSDVLNVENSNQFHLAAKTKDLNERVRFITLIRPYRTGGDVAGSVKCDDSEKTVEIHVSVPEGDLRFSIMKGCDTISAELAGNGGKAETFSTAK